MSTLERLMEEAEEAPEEVLKEVLDFLRYLRYVNRGHDPARNELAYVSETALARDWLRPEEEEAWQYLAVETS